MSIQGQINALIGASSGALIAGAKIANKFSSANDSTPAKVDVEKDKIMAQKARKSAQAKINAIYQNKEISAKARTRRVGKILDDLKGGK